jgi:1-phosphofructokinase
MIYTCTLTPAIDYRIELDDFKLNQLNRANFTKYSAGGKGINVSIILNHLGVTNKALGFMGGFTGEYLKNYLIEKHQLDVDFTKTFAPTRINVKLSLDQSDTEINAKSPMVSEAEFKALITKINELNENDLFILGGSSIDKNYDAFKTIAEICFKKNTPFVIDGEKDNLLKTLPFKPLLIKPNRYELESIFNVTIDSDKAIVHYAKELIKLGAQNVIVSLSDKGSYLINNESVYHAKPIRIKALNTVGAGDSMVAGFIAEYVKNKDIKSSYAMSVAAGTATAMSYDLATKDEILNCLKRVEIEEVNL